MPRERSRSSAIAFLASLWAPVISSCAPSGSVAELLLGHAEVHRQRHQPRLGAVVEVALDPLQLRGLGVDRAGAGALELHQAAALARGEHAAGQRADAVAERARQRRRDHEQHEPDERRSRTPPAACRP